METYTREYLINNSLVVHCNSKIEWEVATKFLGRNISFDFDNVEGFEGHCFRSNKNLRDNLSYYLKEGCKIITVNQIEGLNISTELNYSLF